MSILSVSQRADLLNTLAPRDVDAFRGEGDAADTADGLLVHIDRGSKILAVGHLDWVMHSRPSLVGGRYVRCPQLDDRLGVWLILHELRNRGLKFDTLLTDNEECGRSTGRHFEPPREYNWIFEFDRQGPEDCALYEYSDDATEKLVKAAGYKSAWGSYTDICDLDHLGVKGFNFAVGYHNQHSASCYADLRDTMASADRFCNFYEQHKDTRLGHCPTSYKSSSASRFSRSQYGTRSSYDYQDRDYIWPEDEVHARIHERPLEPWVRDMEDGSDDYCSLCGSDTVLYQDETYCPYCDVVELADVFGWTINSARTTNVT